MNARAKPKLLVSVRSADEARAALAGGADLIDVKEPAHGPLGAARQPPRAALCQAVAMRSVSAIQTAAPCACTCLSAWRNGRSRNG